MAIAGWLMIGLALLVIVAVVNNSWQGLFDQFRQAVSGPQPPPTPAPPTPFEQSGIHEGTVRSGGAGNAIVPVPPPSEIPDHITAPPGEPGPPPGAILPVPEPSETPFEITPVP